MLCKLIVDVSRPQYYQSVLKDTFQNNTLNHTTQRACYYRKHIGVIKCAGSPAFHMSLISINNPIICHASSIRLAMK